MSHLPRGRGRAARFVGRLKRAPFVDVVEPSRLDIRLSIDPRASFQSEMWAGAYQPHVVKWITHNVRAGDRVLCLGLHIGYIAALCRRLAGPAGRVFSAEADPRALELGTRNMSLGDERDAPITVFPGGFGAETSTLQLYQSRVAGHSSFAAPHQSDGKMEVRVERGDRFLMQHECDGIDALVLDVEGWEYEVLRGLEQIVQRSPNLRACIELAPWALADAGTTASEVLTWLASRGIVLQHLHADDWATAQVSDADR